MLNVVRWEVGSVEWTICIKIENIKAHNPNKNGNVDVRRESGKYIFIETLYSLCHAPRLVSRTQILLTLNAREIEKENVLSANDKKKLFRSPNMEKVTLMPNVC